MSLELFMLANYCIHKFYCKINVNDIVCLLKGISYLYSKVLVLNDIVILLKDISYFVPTY